jgi:hypothetical protein
MVSAQGGSAGSSLLSSLIRACPQLARVVGADGLASMGARVAAIWVVCRVLLCVLGSLFMRRGYNKLLATFITVKPLPQDFRKIWILMDWWVERLNF